MARAETIVIDASVAVKWFNKEEYSDDADRLKDAHVRGRIRLAAPELLLYEVLNALRYNAEQP
ncbi:MAG: type II toxin-antitoxin system VapC family toxin [Candidatus Caldarchaeum sp.]|uniref:PIN domain-containing protein n=1 Tax=Caldiarchaeum subterraneum TaxID=311458 RepID=A0A7C4E1E7_CALS0|nr:type II toxin-antitoxin system VapC family toxin [Candidatus Caldarchaeales archaeon]